MRQKSALCTFLLVSAVFCFAEQDDWFQVQEKMRSLLSEAYYSYVASDKEAALNFTDNAYIDIYQALNFEKQAAGIPGRTEDIRNRFEGVKNSIRAGKTQKEIRDEINALTRLLRVTANRLDGKEEKVAERRNWTQTAEEMSGILDKAHELYRSGDTGAAKAQVDTVYFQYYEKLGFERNVLAYVSGDRAAKLDGRNESALGVFLASLLIIVREGAEAIIIVGAILAYLIKSGNKKRTRPVYIGTLIALAVSVVMAYILNLFTSTASGQNQELIEGFTMLLAVGVLFYVSNWMVSKAEAEVWAKYIEGKVQSSITRGSMFSLAFAAFLAVFREGAETILFYQALLAGTSTFFNMVWLGLFIGIVILVVLYILIRALSITLPLKSFFLGTSVLLFIMSISFAGSGIKELQEGNLVGVTPIGGFGSVDILGIYPTLETLIPQVLLLLFTIAVFVFQMKKWGKAKNAAS